LHGGEHKFQSVARGHFSPPTVRRTWFHLGDIDDETLNGRGDGSLPEIDFADEYFVEDPALLHRSSDEVRFLRQLPPRARREALRALRGTVLRTEFYADDSTRPFTVTENLTGLREEEQPSLSEPRKRIFFPHLLAQRTTRWERGNDPMTRFEFTGDYDTFGQPRQTTEIACPRGWRALADRPSAPYLATHTRTEFARAKNSEVFIEDRIANATSFEILNDGSRMLLHVKEQAVAGEALKVIGQTFNFYDGPAFLGLPNREVGHRGALVRTETLVLTEEVLQQAYKSDDTFLVDRAIPPYLNSDGPLVWTPEYPEEFRARIESLRDVAGYIFHRGDANRHRGYFASSARKRYDFQALGTAMPRGLVRAVRDPVSRDSATGEPGTHDTTIEYDAFDLLPVTVTDPVGLTTQASYDMRVLQPVEVIDPNGNRTHYTYTPLGLLKTVAALGKRGEFVGDEERLAGGRTHDVPGTQFEYDFLDVVNSPPNARTPISVRTFRRVHHVSETDVSDAARRDETIDVVEYSDGFGRMLQTRSLAEDDTVGDAIFGGGLLAADQSVDPGDIVLRPRNAIAKQNVVVSGAQRYDNKGRVIEKFEPYFDLESGFEYRPPSEDRFGQKVTMFYDPVGRLIRTVNPDGSSQQVVHGVPGSIRKPHLLTPDTFEPSPWEEYTYDENDLAPLSREVLSDGTQGATLADQAPRHHHFTPSSILVDALGRTIAAVARNRDMLNDAEEPLPAIQSIETRTEYDIRGNAIKVVDALQRDSFRYVYDLANNTLRTENIDGGVCRRILDATGSEVERRDSKGAIVLRNFDLLHRPTRVWARDDRASDITLRQRLVYGDDGDREVNRSVNRLGRLHRHYDEAGLLELAAYDFKGNALERRRQVIRDEAILASFPDRRERDVNWNIRAFRVNWDPLEQQEHTLLAEQTYESSTTYDALNRVKTMLYPRAINGARKDLRPTYNRAGSLKSVVLDGVTFVREIMYNAKGQRTFVALGNGVMTLYAYDRRTSRLNRMFSARFTAIDERRFRPRPLITPEDRKRNLHQDLSYEYDLSGNITRVHDQTPESGIMNSLLGRDALDRRFEYDALYRIVSAAGREIDPGRHHIEEPFDPRPRGTDLTKAIGYRERYRYDVLGNVEELSHVTVNGSFSGFVRRFDLRHGTNQLAALTFGQTVFKYVYDANGNMTDEATSRHFEWDHDDRMKVFRVQTTPGGSAGGALLSEPTIHAHYLYDSAGTRVKKLVRMQGGGTQVTECIDGVFEHHRESGVQNNTLSILDGERRVAEVRMGGPIGNDATPAVKYHCIDHLGSNTLVVTDSGELVNREEFSPYGETSFGSVTRKRYRFVGKERDTESGLNHHQHRYYAPWLSRWISTDPFGLVDGANVYRYARNSPLLFVDPTGTQSRPRAVGDINPHRKQGHANYDSNNKRIDESEHLIPRASKEAITYDPTTRRSDYDRRRYDNDVTVIVERDFALNKTNEPIVGDNARSERLTQLVRQDKPTSYSQERSDTIDNTKRARDVTKSSVTDDQIHRTLLAEDGEMFESFTLEETGRRIKEFEERQKASDRKIFNSMQEHRLNRDLAFFTPSEAPPPLLQELPFDPTPVGILIFYWLNPQPLIQERDLFPTRGPVLLQDEPPDPRPESFAPCEPGRRDRASRIATDLLRGSASAFRRGW
jgi:RHS repeat-associated protein